MNKMASFSVFKPVEKPKTIYTGGTLEYPKYMPTLFEWLRYKGIRKVQGGSVTLQNDYGVYTVPANYSFFINSVYMDTNLAAGTQAVLFISQNTSEKIIALNGVKAATNSFPIPLKIEAGTQIILSTLGNGLVQYGFDGFLIKNSDIPSF